jgi:hypothetical protein
MAIERKTKPQWLKGTQDHDDQKECQYHDDQKEHQDHDN